MNAPKPPKGVRFYGNLLLALSLICLLLLILISFLKPKAKETPEAVLTSETTATESQTRPSAASPRSVGDPLMAKKVESFFGPLPEEPENIAPLNDVYPVRGIYLGQAAHDDLEAALALARKTEINAFVIDVKESWGLCYQSQVPLAVEMSASSGTLDLQKIFKRCHDEGIYVIARVVCFKDEVMSEKRPDLCIRDASGALLHFPLEGELSFASPYQKDVWQYFIDIAREVHRLGADEIQFDYIRFPTGQASSETPPFFGEGDVPDREYAINRFLETAVLELQEKEGVPVTADLFSIVLTSPQDGKAIGQNWNTIGLTGLHAICPMIYPSHYANASYGSQGNGVGSYIGNDFFEAPDLRPYDVVINAIMDGGNAARQRGYARLRPWLQAFTASYLPEGYYAEYGPEEIRAQISACYRMGIHEWLLWNASHRYPEAAFLDKAEGNAQMEELRRARESILQEREQLPEQPTESSRHFPIATAPETLPALTGDAPGLFQP